MSTIEETLYQTQNESRQDPLNFPIRLNNKLGHLGSLSGFGSFSVRERKERQGRNPATGQTMTIAASKNVGFKAAKALKDAVN